VRLLPRCSFLCVSVSLFLKAAFNTSLDNWYYIGNRGIKKYMIFLSLQELRQWVNWNERHKYNLPVRHPGQNVREGVKKQTPRSDYFPWQYILSLPPARFFARIQADSFLFLFFSGRFSSKYSIFPIKVLRKILIYMYNIENKT